ncbi:MAG: hypothetical protein WC449_02480 [Candidatus Paceibacterota bacterium]
MYDLREVVAFFPGQDIERNLFSNDLGDWDDEPESEDEGAAQPDMTALGVPEYGEENPLTIYSKVFNGTPWVLISDVEKITQMPARSISKKYTQGIARAFYLHTQIAMIVMTNPDIQLETTPHNLCRNFSQCYQNHCSCYQFHTYIPEIVGLTIIDSYANELLGIPSLENELPANPHREVRDISFLSLMEYENEVQTKYAHLLRKEA